MLKVETGIVEPDTSMLYFHEVDRKNTDMSRSADATR